MAEERAAELGIEPLAAITSYAWAGVEPHIMGIGPVPAVKKLFERTGLSFRDMDLVELNEAFAAQALAVSGTSVGPRSSQRERRRDILGHPIGASGAGIL